MKYKHIFFDLDRTLWDFEANSKETFEEIFNKYNLNKHCDFNTFHTEYRKINAELWAEYRIGTISKEFLSWQRFYRAINLFGIDNEEMAKDMSADYIKISPTKTKLFPNTKEVLEFLSNKYKLHLVTNGFKEVQYVKINNSGIDKYFTSVFTSEEVGCNKPNKAFFEHVLEHTGADISESAIVGDDIEADIKGAANMHIDTVWFNPDNLETDYIPTYKINTLDELKNIFN